MNTNDPIVPSRVDIVESPDDKLASYTIQQRVGYLAQTYERFVTQNMVKFDAQFQRNARYIQAQDAKNINLAAIEQEFKLLVQSSKRLAELFRDARGKVR